MPIRTIQKKKTKPDIYKLQKKNETTTQIREEKNNLNINIATNIHKIAFS